jgi:hypothetical protein
VGPPAVIHLRHLPPGLRSPPRPFSPVANGVPRPHPSVGNHVGLRKARCPRELVTSLTTHAEQREHVRDPQAATHRGGQDLDGLGHRRTPTVRRRAR